jgi:hypothetical protein
VPARLYPPFGSPNYYLETGLNPKGVALTEVQVNHLFRAFALLSDKVREFTRKLASAKELRDRDVRRALDLLLEDGQLDQPLLEALERARSSLP